MQLHLFRWRARLGQGALELLRLTLPSRCISAVAGMKASGTVSKGSREHSAALLSAMPSMGFWPVRFLRKTDLTQPREVPESCLPWSEGIMQTRLQDQVGQGLVAEAGHGHHGLRWRSVPYCWHVNKVGGAVHSLFPKCSPLVVCLLLMERRRKGWES